MVKDKVKVLLTIFCSFLNTRKVSLSPFRKRGGLNNFFVASWNGQIVDSEKLFGILLGQFARLINIFFLFYLAVYQIVVTRVETELKYVWNGAAKQVSAEVIPSNIVCFVKLFRTSVARKVESLSTVHLKRSQR